jgi:hypothetical protein
MIFEDACDGIQSVGLMDYPLDPWTSTKILVSVSDFPLQITKFLASTQQLLHSSSSGDSGSAAAASHGVN